MTVVLVVNNRVHQILRDQKEIPKWPLMPEAFPGQPIEERTLLFVEAPDDVELGWYYDPETGAVTAPIPIPEPPTPEERKGYDASVDWDEEKQEWVISYILNEGKMSLHILDTVLGVNHE